MTPRDLIGQADRIRQGQGLTATAWGVAAGLDECGVAVGRTFKRGDCKLTTMNRLLEPLGYELAIVKKGDSL